MNHFGSIIQKPFDTRFDYQNYFYFSDHVSLHAVKSSHQLFLVCTFNHLGVYSHTIGTYLIKLEHSSSFPWKFPNSAVEKIAECVRIPKDINTCQYVILLAGFLSENHGFFFAVLRVLKFIMSSVTVVTIVRTWNVR
jgi:hypothetical protein